MWPSLRLFNNNSLLLAINNNVSFHYHFSFKGHLLIKIMKKAFIFSILLCIEYCLEKDNILIDRDYYYTTELIIITL